ncbi:MAG: hypothetical protein JO117_02295 [Verrucomicrobia bacterium]|nr:hypothetical protein [Verrucomicrobiota bacterium]
MLRPDELVPDRVGRSHRLPRFFYEIADWPLAKATFLTPHFRLSELVVVDCREDDRLLHEFPHYVPCAVALLVRCLEALRAHVGDAPVFIAANGAYRSPAHRLDSGAVTDGGGFGPHQWAVAADIYRIGDIWLNTRSAIEKYADFARALGPDVRIAPYGHGIHESDDHLHLDLGYARMIPVEVDEEVLSTI